MANKMANWLIDLSKSRLKEISRSEIAVKYRLSRPNVTIVMRNNGVIGYYKSGPSGKPESFYAIKEVNLAVANRRKEAI